MKTTLTTGGLLLPLLLSPAAALADAYTDGLRVLTVLGIGTLFFGLIVLMPLIGHASWHAYRDLVEQRAASDHPDSPPATARR